MILVALMFLTALFTEVSVTVTAPPPAGTLNVTWENLAPDTNTFQGDVNLSMLSLTLMADGADIIDPLDKKQHWKWFDPNDPGGSPLKALEPGMGIWMHIIQAGVWEIKGD